MLQPGHGRRSSSLWRIVWLGRELPWQRGTRDERIDAMFSLAPRPSSHWSDPCLQLSIGGRALWHTLFILHHLESRFSGGGAEYAEVLAENRGQCVPYRRVAVDDEERLAAVWH